MYTMQWRRGTIAEWTERNPVLREGEPGYEIDTGKYKVGDGVTYWLDLPYFLDENGVLVYIQGWMDNGNVDLLAHVNSPTPHSVYDDGPSLLLLYENAKV